MGKSTNMDEIVAACVLPKSKMFCEVVELKTRHLVFFSESVQKNPALATQLFVALVCTFDGKYLTLEQVLDLSLEDYMAVSSMVMKCLTNAMTNSSPLA